MNTKKVFCDKCRDGFADKSKLVHVMIPHFELQNLNVARLEIDHVYLCNDCVRDVLTYIKINKKDVK